MAIPIENGNGQNAVTFSGRDLAKERESRVAAKGNGGESFKTLERVKHFFDNKIIKPKWPSAVKHWDEGN